LIVAAGKLSHGFSAVVIAQRSDDGMTKSNISKNCTFDTDHWNAFAEVLPAERHVVGKSGTFTIEQNNSNARHHLGWFIRDAQRLFQRAMIGQT
jgi:IS1 family transposase